MLELTSITSYAIALLAALSGSLHCLGMCGPLRLMAGRSAFSGAKYQGGRLLAYLALGAAAGSLGSKIPPWSLYFMVGAAVLFHLLQIRPMAFYARWRHSLMIVASANPILVGLVSGLLPCGLLHGWIGAAAVTANPIQGTILLFLLWLGSLPILEVGARALRTPMELLRMRFPRTLPIILLLIALVPLALRGPSPLPTKEATVAPHSCH